MRTSGLDGTRDLVRLQPEARVLVLTATAGGSVHQSRQTGAVGCVFKGGSTDNLVTAVRDVAAGGTAWTADPLLRINGCGRGWPSLLA